MSEQLKYFGTIYVIASLRGGVGKTKLARLLCSTFLAGGESFFGLDTDGINENSARPTYGMAALWPKDAELLAYKKMDGTRMQQDKDEFSGRLIEIVEAAVYKHVVIDCGAGESLYLLGLLQGDGIVNDIVDAGYRVRILVPVTNAASTHGTVTEVDNFLRQPEFGRLKSICECYVVLDAALGAASADLIDRRDDFTMELDYPAWQASTVRHDALAVGWRELILPTLSDLSVYHAFEQALAAGLVVPPRDWAEGLEQARGRILRRRMERWLNACETVLGDWAGVGNDEPA